MATATAPKSSETVEVELPMCPTCGRVSKLPVGYFGGKTYCHGPIGEKHKPIRMRPATFRLVEEDES
jgi:hypothetical protein